MSSYFYKSKLNPFQYANYKWIELLQFMKFSANYIYNILCLYNICQVQNDLYSK